MWRPPELSPTVGEEVVTGWNADPGFAEDQCKHHMPRKVREGKRQILSRNRTELPVPSPAAGVLRVARPERRAAVRVGAGGGGRVGGEREQEGSAGHHRPK